ncbi:MULTISPECIES: hypothetical protein [Methylomonas]|uniref:Uncharacterized protein n=2 Tax=Methylomonas TaxID=416 RepID=A0A126T1P7_9GAMM|nr:MULTISPECIES: hypothetical protein [Methylomonas]AMK75997.1 hypothetical protein JT25_005745 [Methylomonas denitrificans]OAH99869.1 hypothetical protein A1342_17030 [Methylomonas methanica]TCV83984.1 hypothetical protein EDE11_108114 [Methylomonas methanica]
MTQPLLLILLGELSLVLSTGLIVLLVVNRRNKRRRLAGLEELLEDIKDRQERRGDRLALALVGKHHVDEQTAREVSATLIAAEKQFLFGFVEQQMQQQTVSGFYENLCRLLDSYLDGVPTAGEKPVAEQPAGDAEEQLTDADAEQPKPADSDAIPAEEAPPPPDWGDVFD